MWTPCTVLLSFLRTFLELVTRGCSRHVFQLDPRHTCDFIARFCRTRARLSSCTLLRLCRIIAKFHYTDTDTTRTRPDQTKSAHIVGDELNSTTRTRHGPARTFFAAKLRWVRAGPVGSVSWNLARTRQRARTLSVSGPCPVRVGSV